MVNNEDEKVDGISVEGSRVVRFGWINDMVDSEVTGVVESISGSEVVVKIGGGMKNIGSSVEKIEVVWAVILKETVVDKE